MAKKGGGGEPGGDKDRSEKPETEESAAPWEAFPEALRDAGRRASDLAQNPYARSLLAAGLVTAATALAANKNVRETTRRNLKEATGAAEVAADNASKVGTAIINAATEAVQRMMALAGSAATATASEPDSNDAPKAEPAQKRTTEPAAAEAAAAKPSARKPKAASGTAAAKSTKPASARKPAGSGSAAKGSGKTSDGGAGGGAPRKRAPKQSG